MTIKIGTTPRTPCRRKPRIAQNDEINTVPQAEIDSWTEVGKTSADKSDVLNALSRLIHLPFTQMRQSMDDIQEIRQRLSNWIATERFRAAV